MRTLHDFPSPGPETVAVGNRGDGKHQVGRRPAKLIEARRRELATIRRRREAAARADRWFAWAGIIAAVAIVVTVICV